MNLLDLIFPPTCEYCGKIGKYICDNCYKKVIFLELKKTEKNDKFFMYKYDGEIRSLLLKYKFRDKSYLCNFFAEDICNCKKAINFLNQYDMIIPVPLHKKRMIERGYNQAGEVAKIISRKLNERNRIEAKNKNRKSFKVIKCETNILIKCKNIQPQSTQKGATRKSNVKNAFCIKNAEKIKGKKILIFDDIYTTGATSNECKRVLIASGAKMCGIMTIAKD